MPFYHCERCHYKWRASIEESLGQDVRCSKCGAVVYKMSKPLIPMKPKREEGQVKVPESWAYEVSLGGHRVIIRFESGKTPGMVKDRACTVGYFPWDRYTELKVRRIVEGVKLDAWAPPEP